MAINDDKKNPSERERRYARKNDECNFCILDFRVLQEFDEEHEKIRENADCR